MDFFNVVDYSMNRDPYQGLLAQSYPPICYVIFYIVSRFIPIDDLIMGAKGCRATQGGIVVFLMCTLLLVWAIIEIIKRMSTYRYKGLLVLLLITSGPFLYAIERANIIFLALLLTCHYLFYMDSDNKYLREWSFIALAIAASIKIYPAALGLLLLKDKRWQEAIRLVVYGILFFFVPFLFVGGFGKVPIFIETLVAASANGKVMNGLGYKVNYSTILAIWMGIIKGHISDKMLSVAGILSYIVDVLAIVAAVLNKKRWQTITLLCCLIVGLPGFNYQYAIIFMIPPLILFLNEDEKERGDWIILILFAMQFALVGFGGIKRLEEISGAYPITIGTVMEGTSVLALTGVLVIKTFMSYIKKER